MRKKGRKQKENQERAEKAGNAPDAGFAARGAASKIGGALSFAYSKVPILPFLDRATSAIFLFCALGYFLFTAYIFISAPKPEFELDVDASQLVKNSQLGIYNGESYAYFVRSEDGKNATIFSSVQKGTGCDGVFVTENSLGQEGIAVCVSADGEVEGSKAGSPLVLYSPWMLGVSENFTMTVKATASASYVVITEETFFRSLGKTKKFGREAYGVEITGGGTAQPALAAYIDAEKRVLLYSESGGNSISLVKAPFPLLED